MTAEPVPIRPQPLDLDAIAARHPVRTVTFDVAVAVNSLSTGDMTDLELVLGIDFADLANAPRFDVLAALAWLIGRREQPDLELEEVRRTWRIEPREDPTRSPRKSARRRGPSASPG